MAVGEVKGTAHGRCRLPGFRYRAKTDDEWWMPLFFFFFVVAGEAITGFPQSPFRRRPLRVESDRSEHFEAGGTPDGADLGYCGLA